MSNESGAAEVVENVQSEVQTPQKETKPPITEEFGPRESMPDFAFSLRNIARGYRDIFNNVNDDGTFSDSTAEQQAITKWQNWHNTNFLPQFVKGKEAETMIEIENKLAEVKNGTRFLTYQDRSSLQEYFKRKHPTEKQAIDDVFADFDHDIDFVTGGMNQAFSDDETARTLFAEYRKKAVRKWPEEIIESTAQLFDNNSVSETYQPVQAAKEIRQLFDVISRIGGAKFAMEVDTQTPFEENISLVGNRLWFKRAIYNNTRNVHKYSERHKDTKRKFYNKLMFAKMANQLFIHAEDNRDGFRDQDLDLIDRNKSESVFTKTGVVIKRQQVFGRKIKGTESEGTKTEGKGLGMNILWHVFVNMHNGKVTVNNRLDKSGNPIGSNFYFFLPVEDKAA